MALRENLELDIATALRQVDQLEARLAQVAQQFKGELGDALSALNISVDVASLQQEVEQAVEQADATVMVEGDAEMVTEAVDTAVDDADASVLVEGDAEAVTGAIDDAVDSADPTVDVDADTSEAQAEIEALDGETVEVGVEVDLGDAQGQIDGLGGSAEQATESTDGLGVSVGGLGPKGLAAAGGLAGLIASTTALFTSGLAATSSLQSFNARLGDLAPTIESVEIGGLSTTIGQLAQDLGSSDEAVRDSIAQLVEFGDAAGATDAELEQTSDQFLALAARAVTLNPALGDIGDVVTSLQAGLAKGGKRLAAFGIELTKPEIEARALANTLKQVPSELTQFDLAAAGAQLAAEQLGDSLTGDIATGPQNVALQFGNLQQVFGDTLEEIGKPLVVPVFDLLQAATPVVVSLFEILGDVAAALIPSITNLFAAFEEAQVIDALGAVLAQFANGLSLIIDGVAALISGLGPVAPAIGIVAAALLLLNANPIFAVITAVGVAGSALSGLGQSLGIFSGESRDLEPVIASLESTIFGQVETLDDLASALDDVTGGIKEFLTESDQSEIIADFSDELAEAGVTTDELVGLMQDGANGARILGTRLADAGVDGASLDDGLVDLRGTALDLVDTFKDEQQALSETGKETLNQLVLNGQLTAAQLQAIETTSKLDGETVDYAEALRQATLLTGENAAALEEQVPSLGNSAQAWVDLTDGILQGTITSADYAAVAEQLGVDLVVLEGVADQVTAAITAFADNAVSKLPTVASALGELEDASDPQALIDNLNEQTTAIANFQANLAFLEALGESADAIFALAVENGPVFTNELIKGLREGGPEVAAELEASLEAFETQTDETAAFLRDEATPALVDPVEIAAAAVSAGYRDDLDFTTATVDEIDAAVAAVGVGTPSLTDLTAIMGADAARLYLEQLVLDTGTTEAVAAAGAAIDTAAPGLETAADAAGTATADSFEQGADLEASVRRNVQLGKIELQATGAILSVFAFQAGRDVGNAFDDGIAVGIITGASGVRDAARFVVESAEAAARSAAGIASPSKLFADAVGDPIAQGIAQGIEAGAGGVGAAASRAVAVGAVAAGGTAAVGTVGGGGGLSIGTVDVQVNVDGSITPQQARSAGAAIAEGLQARLQQRQINVDVRTL